MLLLGILLFLSVLIYMMPTEGIWPALGYGALAVLMLQISYIVAGFFFSRSERADATSRIFRRTKPAHSKK